MIFLIGDLVKHKHSRRDIGLVVDIVDYKIYIEWNDGEICWYGQRELEALVNKIS